MNVQQAPTPVMKMQSVQTPRETTHVSATRGIVETGSVAVTLTNVRPMAIMIAMKERIAQTQKAATHVAVKLDGLGMAKFVTLQVQHQRLPR